MNWLAAFFARAGKARSKPDPTPPEAARAALEAFEGSLRSTERAWYGTSLLTLSRTERVQEAMRTLTRGGPDSVARLLGQMVHESYMGAGASIPGFDAGAATQLSAIVSGLLVAEAFAPLACRPESGDERDALQAIEAILQACRNWIASSEVHDGDLARIGDLMREQAGVGGAQTAAGLRAALVAPLGPACGVLRCVIRAQRAHAVFGDGGRAAPGANAETMTQPSAG